MPPKRACRWQASDGLMTMDSVETRPSAVQRLLADITAQFRHRPIAEAAPEIAAHINQFWEPRMRAALRSELVAPTGDDLVDAVLALL